MTLRTLASSIALTLCVASPVQALHLSSNGSGQVLLFPYYTVNSGNQTLLTVVNSTDRGKATLLRFREGRNSRAVFELSVYLAPFDVWTASVFGQGAEDPANLYTADKSCTVPPIRTSTTLPRLFETLVYAPFGNDAYTGARDDAGPDALARTREGHIELIELGEIGDESQGTLAAISSSPFGHSTPDREPIDCDQVVQAWNPGGYWRVDPMVDMLPPGGGLHGTSGIVDVLSGTLFTVAADAIENFSRWALNAAPGTGQPTLASANNGGLSPLLDTHVFADGVPLTLQYPLPQQAIDAVSAVLMADAIQNDFVTAASVAGVSEWVLTFPTKHFYTDIGAGAPIAPFGRSFAAAEDGNGAAPVDFGGEAWTRSGVGGMCIPTIGGPNCESNGPPAASALNWTVNVVTFNQASYYPGATADSTILGSVLKFDMDTTIGLSGPSALDGSSRLTFWEEAASTQVMAQQQLRPDVLARRLRGLPVRGFWVARFTNGQLTPGVLSNYSDAVRHQGSVSITPAAQ
jgi:hypothetical protein